MRNHAFAAVAATVALLLLGGCAANNGPHPIRDRAVIDDPKLAECFAETPIPRDAFSEELLMQSDDPYVGVWSGWWQSGVCHTLIVTSRSDGKYDVLYSSHVEDGTWKTTYDYAIGHVERSSLILDFVKYTNEPYVGYSLHNKDSIGGYYSWSEKEMRVGGTFYRVPLQALEASVNSKTG